MTRPVVMLAQLNDVDLAVDATKSRLHELAEALREPAPLLTARDAASVAEQALANCRAAQEELERSQAEETNNLQRLEGRLYSGAIKAAREVEDAQRDVEQHKRQRAAIEEQLLQAMVDCDSAAAEFEKRQAEAARLQSDWGARAVALHAEQATLRARLPQEQARQAASRRAVPATLLATYDGLRARKGGRAIARIEGDSCSACRVALPPSRLSEALEEDALVYCGNCGRLLWGE